MQEPPLRRLRVLTPYPESKVTSSVLDLEAIAAGRITMDAWQRGYGDAVAFVCVGCDGPQLSTAFSQRLKLMHTKVTVAVDPPSWGQLGCSGFIVLDKNLSVVCSSSAAFLQVRSLAFRHVEALLDALIAGTEIPSICPGVAVKLNALSRQELNRQRALCISGPSGQDKRCVVVLRSGQQLSVKTENLIRDAAGDKHMEAFSAAAERALSQTSTQPAPTCSDGSCGLPLKRKDAQAAVSSCSSEAEVAPLGQIESVGVAVLDKEHEECASALAALQRTRTAASLRQVQDALQKHFAHEEELLDQHLYAGIEDGGGFNKAANQRTSHYSDHARIMLRIAEQLERGADLVPAEVVDAVLRDFETHANTYDDKYAAELSAKLAAGV